MRTTGVAKLTNAEWCALLATEIDAEKVAQDPAAFLQRLEGRQITQFGRCIISLLLKVNVSKVVVAVRVVLIVMYRILVG